jgi:bifunctional non-homologous end joining protein LigD
VVFYAFDLLHLDGRDLIKEPLDARRNALRAIAEGSDVLLSDALPGARQDIERAVRSLGLEGIVAKRRRSTYAVGRRSDAWIKVRFSKHQELVIGGFKPAGAHFDSLVVGYYDGARFLSAGKVRNGFTPLLRAQLYGRLKPLVVERCPFANLPSSRSSHWGEGITAEEMNEIRWVRPVLVAEISFTEWTRDGSLRHAAFLGLREDKDAREVIREG